MASDGMFDNLFHEDILSCLYKYYKFYGRHINGEITNPLAAAECLANLSE
jgi:hypothetical protein